MTATKIQPGNDMHLTLLMAPHSLNFVTGADRAALLAFGRDVFAAARGSKCLAQIEEPAGAAPAAVAGPAPAAPAELIYQISQPFPGDPKNTWRDASQEAYDVSVPDRRRVLFTGPAPAAPAGPVDDMAALVKQLVQALRKAAPENDLAEKALDYLKRQGLQGSPLRSATATPSPLVASREVIADGPVRVTRLHLTDEGRTALTSKATGPLPGVQET